ncbi:MAG: fecI 1 [Rhodospirillales bacterium]|nr:fecI 1 [Rhodospirillales bacterium]
MRSLIALDVAKPRRGEDGVCKNERLGLIAFLRARLGCEQDSNDVAQESYLRLVQAMREGTVANPRAFLYRVAGNLAVDQLRRRRRWRTVDADEPLLAEALGTHPSPEAAFLARDDLERFAAMLEELAPKEREALLLFRIEGCSFAEIGRRMNLSEVMARRYALRALASCAARLEAEHA